MLTHNANARLVCFVASLTMGAGLLPAQDFQLNARATWTQLSPASSPSAREDHRMAYDAARGQVVLFGGFGSSGFLGDTWVWDGSNWTQKTPASSPPARELHAMAYDAARGQVVLFGGYGSQAFGDTWVWDGSNWTQRTPASSPPARYEHTMAYDAARGQVVLFGGAGNSNNGLLGDTWLWGGSNWRQTNLLKHPQPRREHAMAGDAANGQVVLFGGFVCTTQGQCGIYQDTWVWDGTTR